jgi:hypothetical protein
MAKINVGGGDPVDVEDLKGASGTGFPVALPKCDKCGEQIRDDEPSVKITFQGTDPKGNPIHPAWLVHYACCEVIFKATGLPSR